MKNLNLVKRLILLCIYILFIFSNSLTPASISTSNSDFFASLAGDFLSLFNISFAFHFLTFIIRKAAHFTEYFFLGLLLQSTFSKLNQKKKTFIIILLSIFTPICDELLQKITPGRSCEIRDMLLDLSGILCGLLIYRFFIYLKEKKKQSNKQSI